MATYDATDVEFTISDTAEVQKVKMEDEVGSKTSGKQERGNS